MKKYSIGIDIGGTKICGILWDGNKICREYTIPTPKTLSAFKKSITKLVHDLGDAHSIGVAVPGRVHDTIFVKAGNMPYIHNFDFTHLFKDRKVAVEHDARAFLLGESLAQKRLPRKVFGLTLGTGVGRAYMEKNKIVKIKKLEHGVKWESEYQKIRNARNSKKLAEFLSEKIITMVKPYKPNLIIVGGGVTERKNFVALLRNELRKRAHKTQIQKAKFGERAGAIGGAHASSEGKLTPL